jgi:D-2-hydroxyacid dehydrogenase (NADP+)
MADSDGPSGGDADRLQLSAELGGGDSGGSRRGGWRALWAPCKDRAGAWVPVDLLVSEPGAGLCSADMMGLLISRTGWERCAGMLGEVARRNGVELEAIHPPLEGGGALEAQASARVEIAYLSPDVFDGGLREFAAAALAAPRLAWLQTCSAGTDAPTYDGLLARGVVLTHGAGATARPIAQSAIGALLMLARGFLHWGAAQRERAWRRLPAEAVGEDLHGQRLTVFGLGHIGLEVARLGQVLGLHVTGVRRSAPEPGAPIDAWLPPARLAEALPTTQWLALCAPLTAQTRGAIGARELAQLPPGARLLNVARGGLVDEAALIDALRAGRLGGAYLDVFEHEPLPADSALWELPNVILSPHNSAHSRGNVGRYAELFARNLERWLRKEPLENAVDAASR